MISRIKFKKCYSKNIKKDLLYKKGTLRRNSWKKVLLLFNMEFCRIIFTSGWGITGSTINSRTRMRIRITRREASSSRTLAGSWFASTRTSLAREPWSIWAISRRIPSSFGNAGTIICHWHDFLSWWSFRSDITRSFLKKDYRPVSSKWISTFMPQAVYCPDASSHLPTSHLGTVPLLEWETYERVVRHRFEIHAAAECDLAGKFRGPHLGHETIRQVSIIEDPSFAVRSISNLCKRKSIRETCPYFCRSSISPTDSYSVGIGAFGEGWHNYHHVFPWDYKASELGTYRTNFTTGFIDFFARIGWAYDLKTVAYSVIKKRAARTGDGSKYERTDHQDEHHHTHEGAIWGWDDADMTSEDMQKAEIFNKGDWVPRLSFPKPLHVALHSVGVT